MKKSSLFICENGEFTPISDAKSIICGLYAAVGFNGDKKGDLFAVVSGPALVPVYDKNGKRKNVGGDLSGMSYDFRRGEWYNE